MRKKITFTIAGFAMACCMLLSPCQTFAEEADLTETQSIVLTTDTWICDLTEDVMTWTFPESSPDFVLRVEDGTCYIDGTILSLNIFDMDGEESEESRAVFEWMNENPISKIVFSDNVTEVDTVLFATWYFYTAEQVELGKNMESMGSGALAQSKIQSITLPSSLKRIGREAFEGCENLQSITLPKHLEVVGEDAFLVCDSLMDVTVLSRDVTLETHSIGYSSHFQPYDGLVIHGYRNSTAEVYAAENGFTFIALDEQEESTEPTSETTAEETSTAETTASTTNNINTTPATSNTTTASSGTSSPNTGEGGIAAVLVTGITALLGGLVCRKKK